MPVIVFVTAAVSGTFSSSTTLTPGQLLHLGGRRGLRLVVAEVVARADVDHADRQRLLRTRLAQRPRRDRGERQGGKLRQRAAAGSVESVRHGRFSARC
jgi:hypothetical protein